MSGAAPFPEAFTIIVTYGRSGSTLLQNLLNSIPGYQIRGENNNALYHLARSWTAVVRNEQMQAMRSSGAISDQTHPWYGAEQIRPQQYGRALARTFTRTVLKPDPGTRVSGFKEIRFHSDPGFFRPYLNFIHDNFPKVRFVFNTRDHAGVARSGWWADLDTESVVSTLRKAEELYAAYRRHFPDRCHHVHYDEYVADPETLRPLFDFLGETWEARMVERVMQTRLRHLHGPT